MKIVWMDTVRNQRELILDPSDAAETLFAKEKALLESEDGPEYRWAGVKDCVEGGSLQSKFLHTTTMQLVDDAGNVLQSCTYDLPESTEGLMHDETVGQYARRITGADEHPFTKTVTSYEAPRRLADLPEGELPESQPIDWGAEARSAREEIHLQVGGFVPPSERVVRLPSDDELLK